MTIYRGVDYPAFGSPPQDRPTLKPLPCPFCGQAPKVLPSLAQVKRGTVGSAGGDVICVAARCTVRPCADDGCDLAGEFGVGWYKDQAIKRWNRRAPAPDTQP